MMRHGVVAGVGDTPGEHGHEGVRPAGEGVGDLFDLCEGEERSGVQLHAFGGERALDRGGARPVRVGDRDLHVHLRAPRRDLERLAEHAVGVVGEDLERDRAIGDQADEVDGERLVVLDARPRISVGLVVKPWMRGLLRSSRIPSRSAPSAKILVLLQVDCHALVSDARASDRATIRSSLPVAREWWTPGGCAGKGRTMTDGVDARL